MDAVPAQVVYSMSRKRVSALAVSKKADKEN